MEAKAVLLMVIVILIALHLNMHWLALLLGVVSFFMAISMISTQKKEEKEAAPAGEEEEQVLTPVVVQDVGEPPDLYPPSFKLKVSDQYKGKAWFEIAVGTFANIVGFMKHIFTGKPPKSD